MSYCYGSCRKQTMLSLLLGCLLFLLSWLCWAVRQSDVLLGFTANGWQLRHLMSFWVLPLYFYGAFVCWIRNDPFIVIFLLGHCWVYFGFFSFQGSTNNIERKACSFWFIFLILESVTVKGALNSKIVFLDLIKQENFDLCSQSRCWGSIQKDRRSGSTDR